MHYVMVALIVSVAQCRKSSSGKDFVLLRREEIESQRSTYAEQFEEHQGSKDAHKHSIVQHGHLKDHEFFDQREVQVPVNKKTDVAKKGFIALVGLLFLLPGLLLVYTGHKVAGWLTSYFALSTTLALLDKYILSEFIVSEDELYGIPTLYFGSAVASTAGFLYMASIMSVLSFTRWANHVPKLITYPREWVAIIGISVILVMYQGPSNLGYAFLDISLSKTIRSCLPIATVMILAVLSFCWAELKPNETLCSMALIVAGVAFAVLAAVATQQNRHANHTESTALFLGVVFTCTSVAARALQLIAVKILKDRMSWNAVEITFYQALPASCIMVGLCSVSHPVPWRNQGWLTDWEVMGKVIPLNKSFWQVFILRGIVGVAFNIVKYTVVHETTPTYAAIAGNVNKAAVILLSVLAGFEPVPENKWGVAIWVAIISSFICFASYSMMKKL